MRCGSRVAANGVAYSPMMTVQCSTRDAAAGMSNSELDTAQLTADKSTFLQCSLGELYPNRGPTIYAQWRQRAHWDSWHHTVRCSESTGALARTVYHKGSHLLLLSDPFGALDACAATSIVGMLLLGPLMQNRMRSWSCGLS